MKAAMSSAIVAAAVLLTPVMGEVGITHASVEAQLTTELPGVPSPGVPTLSRSRSEWAWEGALTWRSEEAGVRRFVESRAALARSYRILRNGEVGVRLTLADVSALIPEEGTDSSGAATRWDGSVGYGVTLGAKYRFLSLVDLDGHGIEAAVVGTWRPRLEPALRYFREGDDVRGASGLLGGRAAASMEDAAPAPPVEVPARRTAGFVVGVRQRRWLADASLVHQTVGDAEFPWVRSSEGMAFRAGVMGQVTRGTSVGLAWWGGGDPPWDNAPVRPDAGRSDPSYGLVLSLTERRGAGTRLMVTAPTGSFSDSLRLYILGYAAR